MLGLLTLACVVLTAFRVSRVTTLRQVSPSLQTFFSILGSEIIKCERNNYGVYLIIGNYLDCYMHFRYNN